MEPKNVSKDNNYKTLSVVLMVVLVMFSIGAFVYWRDLNNTQKEQQAQIEALNQQIAEDRQTRTSELEETRNQAAQELEDINSDSQTNPDDTTTGSSGPDTLDDSPTQ